MCTSEFLISKEAAWAISNATSGGTHDQIKYAKCSPFVFVLLYSYYASINCLLTHHLFARYLVSQGCIKAFCDFLGHSDCRILTVCLEGLGHILKVGEEEKSSGVCDVNIFAQMIEDADALEKIEELQNNDNDMIYQMAAHLLETFWVEEDDVMPAEENEP